MTVIYPDLSNLSNTSGISGLLTLPNASYPFFWTIILAGIFIILSSTMYYREKALKGVGNLLSSMAVSSFACIVLATFGSLVGIFTVTYLVYIAVVGIVIIALWIFSKMG